VEGKERNRYGVPGLISIDLEIRDVKEWKRKRK